MLLPCLAAVPALGGRTALEAYTDLMVAFRDQFSQLLGTVVTDADIGLGPKGEFRYPSTPVDSRWNFPGIGEFQVRTVPNLLPRTPCFVPSRSNKDLLFPELGLLPTKFTLLPAAS